MKTRSSGIRCADSALSAQWAAPKLAAPSVASAHERTERSDLFHGLRGNVCGRRAIARRVESGGIRAARSVPIVRRALIWFAVPCPRQATTTRVRRASARLGGVRLRRGCPAKPLAPRPEGEHRGEEPPRPPRRARHHPDPLRARRALRRPHRARGLLRRVHVRVLRERRATRHAGRRTHLLRRDGGRGKTHLRGGLPWIPIHRCAPRPTHPRGDSPPLPHRRPHP